MLEHRRWHAKHRAGRARLALFAAPAYIQAMRTVYAVQHSEAEFLGLIEDHLEGRDIRFHYLRPFANRGWVPPRAVDYDALILLGGGPWGAVSEPLLPSLERELRLARSFLADRRPVIGIGLGAQILSLAAGGKAEAAALGFTVGRARRLADDALNGHLPASYPLVTFMRDRPLLPEGARLLAADEQGRPALFQVGDNCLGFTGHPGIKSGMIEDLVMEFADAPEDVAAGLTQLRAAQPELASALSEIMVGVIQLTRLMRPRDDKRAGGNK